MPDLAGHQVQERPGGAGRRAGQVPYLAGGAGVGAQGGQAGGDVGDVAVGVRQVGVADEVGAPAGQGVAEDSLAERGPCGDAGAEEVRGPPDGDPDPAGRGGGQQLGGHGRPGPALDAGGGQRQVLGHRAAAGRAVAVQVLQADQQRAGAFGGGQHPPLQRREPLRPLVVRGVQALVDRPMRPWPRRRRLRGRRHRRPASRRRPARPAGAGTPPGRRRPARPGARPGHCRPARSRKPRAADPHP